MENNITNFLVECLTDLINKVEGMSIPFKNEDWLLINDLPHSSNITKTPFKREIVGVLLAFKDGNLIAVADVRSTPLKEDKRAKIKFTTYAINQFDERTVKLIFKKAIANI